MLAQAGLIRMLDDRAQRSIEIERAEGPFLSQPLQNRAASPGKKITHRQTAEPTAGRVGQASGHPLLIAKRAASTSIFPAQR